MECHNVGRLRVDTLDNVNLARVGPVGSKHPKGRPGSGDATGHVFKVRNEEAVGKGLLRRETNRPATVRGVLGLMVYTHKDLAVDKTGQSLIVGSLRINVFDKAVSWVVRVEEIPSIEEVGSVVGDIERVLGVNGALEYGSKAKGNK